MAQDVPAQFKRPLELLSSFTDDQMERLLSSIDEATFVSNRLALREALEKAANGDKNRRNLRELSAMIMALARLFHDEPDDAEFLTRLANGPNLELANAHREVLAERLKMLVRLPAVNWASRAAHDERNHERMLTRADLQTDVRPLLDDRGKIRVVVPWHTLNFRYTSRQFTEDQAESIVLDHDDLISLREKIDDALEVQLNIQSDMERLGILVWDPYLPEVPGTKED